MLAKAANLEDANYKVINSSEEKQTNKSLTTLAHYFLAEL